MSISSKYNPTTINPLPDDLWWSQSKGVGSQLFWENIQSIGTPLFEPVPGDDSQLFCTFLYRGSEDTVSVWLDIPPYSRLSPKEFELTQVPGTDVWRVRVKLPAKSRLSYHFVVNFPIQSVGPDSPSELTKDFTQARRADPLNTKRIGLRRSYVEPPYAAPQKYLAARDDVSKGNLTYHSIRSEVLNNERSVTVYLPQSWEPGRSYPLAVIYDEQIYLKEIEAPRILDNLLAEGLIPPMIVAFVGHSPDARADELTCNSLFADFIAGELLPWLSTSYSIDESRRVVGGASYGGLAAVFTALRHPNLFSRVLSQSGSFWWSKAVAEKTGTDPILALSKDGPRSAQRFYLDAGTDEIELRFGISLLESNKQLVKTLDHEGFIVHFQTFAGGHGALNWRGTFSEGLIWLTSDWMSS